MRNVNPILNPLLNDLYYAGIGNYLTTSNFKRLAIKSNFIADWQKWMDYVERNKTAFVAWANTYDEQETLELLFFDHLNITKNMFEKTAFEIIYGFINWLKEPTNFDEVFADLEVISFNLDFLEKLRTLHAEKQASLASQAEQQVSPQVTVLPTPVPTTAPRDTIISHIEKNDFSYAFRELKALSLESNDIVWLENFKKEYIAGKTDHRFVDRLRTFVDTVCPEV